MIFKKKENETEALISFYSGKKVNADGIYINDMLKLSAKELLSDPKYFYWLFPGDTKVKSYRKAPIMTPDAISKFIQNKNCILNMVLACRRVLGYYGFEMTFTDGNIQINQNRDFLEVYREGIKKGDIPHRERIARILKALNLVGMRSLVNDLYNQLFTRYQATGRIKLETLMLWKECAGVR